MLVPLNWMSAPGFFKSMFVFTFPRQESQLAGFHLFRLGELCVTTTTLLPISPPVTAALLEGVSLSFWGFSLSKVIIFNSEGRLLEPRQTQGGR